MQNLIRISFFVKIFTMPSAVCKTPSDILGKLLIMYILSLLYFDISKFQSSFIYNFFRCSRHCFLGVFYSGIVDTRKSRKYFKKIKFCNLILLQSEISFIKIRRWIFRSFVKKGILYVTRKLDILQKLNPLNHHLLNRVQI